ncbi:Interferon-induced very large GTPase 1 [Collichthys lucidus]|uniref:Interferon-induced very large GTPase 1 n=1 Tax=Collichthys lucidus TaxID=240159 RepID=A0A4U5VS98_COLLU|nr:Interferon-induced very large GTPase 1 [Collichthys lucidus]
MEVNKSSSESSEESAEESETLEDSSTHVTPELTLVLIGDTKSIEIGSKNILLDHEKHVGQVSSKLYDLCGRHISVIDMLGLQSIDTDTFLLKKGIYVFLLLLTNGLHNSHYSSGLQWLEKAFGKGSLSYLLTVVTHESDEKCELALTDLKANSSFDEKRYHTCTRSMMDETEIIALFEKIDVMVSGNDPHCYSRLMCGENKEQEENLDDDSDELMDAPLSMQNQTGTLDMGEDKDTVNINDPHCYSRLMCDKNKEQEENLDDESDEEEWFDSLEFQQNQTVDEPEDSAAETEAECDLLNEPGRDEHSQKNDDNMTGEGESDIKSEPSTNKDKADEPEDSAAETEAKCDPLNEPGRDEHSQKNDDNMTREGESDIKSEPSTAKEKVDEPEDSAAETEAKCDPLNEPGRDEHSQKNDDNTTRERESDIKSEPSTAKEKDMDVGEDKNTQSVKISEEINKKEQHERETEKLFGRLHLQDKHQQKFTPADFLKIGPTLKLEDDTCEKDLAHTFLQRLMMLDYRARYIPVRQDSPEVSLSNPVPVFDNVETDDSDLDALFSTRVNSDQSKQTHVHPMDVQMAVFHCSDSFLKQNMITKLSQCQYALPLLVPDPVTMDVECPLWTFRQIKKTWKITKTEDDSNIVTMKSMPICKAETPMVSFLRLGSLSLSKSQLMNTLINDRHNTFFHRNCPGSTKSRHLMDGVVEIAWYCPSGKPNDAFTDCVAFCNLHGDALLIEKQRDILTERSSVNVVLVPTLEKGHESITVISNLLESLKPLIILIADDDCGTAQMKKGKYKLGLKDKSQSDVSEELKRIMRNILSGPHDSFKLETMAKVPEIKVDENDTVCQTGKSAAMKIVDLFQEMDVSKIKDTFLPCQGKLWHEWSRINKELYHLKGDIEMEKCEKQQKLKTIRQNQQKASSSELMKLFIESLSSLKSTDKEYFLKWIQILIDALCTGNLSSILQRYDKTWSEVLTLKKNHDKSNPLDNKQIELDQISAKLQSATFGLEHIFREMGQIYEAHKSLQEQTNTAQTDWVRYPELAAELMISGHPMELMDGDAGHVPLTWISSLLDEVIKKLGDKKVFVLSVLGVQSSGKSTMLNAMFGLQFAVSAGRCTKGAFMQLIRVSEEIKTNFQFDYVLVVDTEGLRALELEGNTNLHHDNELATFVVGLGNMTLINIFGENPADMQDVLQIVVQAFMRMKEVKLSPSCVFVHQNVTDVAAAEKNMDGKRRLQEKLDKMAQLAAKEEVCDAECFSDVIAFDVQKDVKYFAQLWEGSPPMAPPNPGYTESVQELKNFILSKASQSAGITLSQFKSKIHDLWNALLNENFVFSFKNTLEVAVYRKLEVQYGNWTWTLRSKMLTTENQLHTEIENGKLDKVELSYLNKEINQTYEKIKEDMKAHFDDKRDKEMLVQWKGRFENKIKEFCDGQVREVKRKLDEVIQQRSACKKLEDKKTEFENKLLQKSKELAHQLKDKAKDEEELEKQFDSHWTVCVREITESIKPIEDINLEEDQSTILRDLGFEWSLIAESKKSGNYKNISKLGDYIQYVSFTKQQDKKKKNKTIPERWVSAFKERLGFGSETQHMPHEEQELIRSLIHNVEKQSLDLIRSKPVATRGYSSTYLQEVANIAKEKVTEFESQRQYALKKEFTVDLLLYVFDKIGSWLSESHKKFKKNNDAPTYLETKKIQYYNIFRSFCKGNSSAVVLGELICEKLKSSTVEAVCNKTAIDLSGEMRCRCPAFSGNRLNLEKHVLKSLAEKEDFDGFITYIQRPKKQVETFIKEEVKKYIFTENKDEAQKILKKNVEDLKRRVSQALFTATEEVRTQRGEKEERQQQENEKQLKKWVEKFSSSLTGVLKFDTISFENFRDINKFDFLKEEIEKGLECIMHELSSLPLDKMNEFRLQPDQILIDQLCDCCWETCPFCAAVCTNTVKDHLPDKHNVPFHRPNGIKGWHKRGTDELVIDFCTTLVASDRCFRPRHDSDETCPYKEYQKAGERFASWKITPDESKLTYWKWFVCRFQKQLEEHHKLKFHGKGEIPPEWRNYSKQEAINSLDEMIKS